jgi:2-iminobutanoate/2-iminopropanoate deaminase
MLACYRRNNYSRVLTSTPALEYRLSRRVVKTDAAPKSRFYSQAVIANGLVFVSGQGPFDPVTGNVVGETIQEQTRQCLTNLKAILDAGGSSLDRAVSATFILRDPEDFEGMNEEWARWFPTDPPARQGAKLPLAMQGLRISIAIVALAE